MATWNHLPSRVRVAPVQGFQLALQCPQFTELILPHLCAPNLSPQVRKMPGSWTLGCNMDLGAQYGPEQGKRVGLLHTPSIFFAASDSAQTPIRAPLDNRSTGPYKSCPYSTVWPWHSLLKTLPWLPIAFASVLSLILFLPVPLPIFLTLKVQVSVITSPSLWGAMSLWDFHRAPLPIPAVINTCLHQPSPSTLSSSRRT